MKTSRWKTKAFAGLVLGVVAAAGCRPGAMSPAFPPGSGNQTSGPSGPATAAEAETFVREVNAELKRLAAEVDRAAWLKATYITPDSEYLEAKAREKLLEFVTRKVKESQRFAGLALPPETARSLYVLKYSAGLPAPSDPTKRARLATVSTELESIYGRGKYCSPKLVGKGDDPKSDCLTVDEINRLLGKQRDYELLLEAWRGWHTVSPPMRSMYGELVTLGNEGARELGFKDMAEIWKGGYDMSDAQFEAEADRLWQLVQPLYQKLHCFARARLAKQYGARVDKKAPIPAHLLGNLWAQEWQNLYPMMEPYPGRGTVDLDKQLQNKKYDAQKMVKLGEQFFTSLGMQPLPKTFWERSLFVKPRDREVVCHASAWDVGLSGDIRIKMCIRPEYDDLMTIHHELGHNYYYLQYGHLPPLFQAGANDGFHEGIGDTLILSMTPGYLKKIGILDSAPDDPKNDLNALMRRALEAIAFLPFGKVVDEWRWRVFDGRTAAADYNKTWWELRRKYQGIAPDGARSETDFDPGAKYHVPANVPYTRYFIARILQYQFHRALCRAAGHQGPLYKCSIYGSREAGTKLMAMLRLGASKPWADALAELSGERTMDASAILDYYAPLAAWLDEQNKAESCGWDGAVALPPPVPAAAVAPAPAAAPAPAVAPPPPGAPAPAAPPSAAAPTATAAPAPSAVPPAP
ncbi:MAG TPA: M2 family metallopeptidase, partial [Polyangiaceae bacterium]